MTLTRRWSSGAVVDLRAGAMWYDERQPGLGAEFVTEAFETANTAMTRPHTSPRCEHPNLPSETEFRKAQLRRFSEYGVIYTLVGETFWILAVAHAKRRPGYWTSRIDRGS